MVSRRTINTELEERVRQRTTELDDVNQQLRISEQRYHTLIKHFPDGNVLLFDRDLRYTVADGTALQVAGLTSEDLTGHTMTEVLPSPLREALEQPYRRALQGISSRVESVVSGRTYVIDIVPVFDVHGVIESGMSVSHEITDRKRAEEALRISEQRYRTLMEHFPSGAVMLFDEELRYVVAGGSALGKPGMLGREIVGHTLMEVLPPRVHQVLEPIYRATLNGAERRFERTTDGRTFDVEIVPVRDQQGTVQGGMVVSHDITEHKRAEEAMRISEQRYRTLMKNFPDGAVMLFDRDLRYTIADGNALRALGMYPEHLEGRTLADVLPPEACARLEPFYRAALTGHATQFEDTTGDATFDVHIIPVTDEQEAVQGGMVVSYDITKRKRAEQEVARLNAELEERVRQRTAQLEAANTELEAFSYSVSHDLRTPLRSIDGFNQAIIEDYGDQLDATAQGYLERVRNATTRMAQLIDDMLNLSQVSRSEMFVGPVNLSDLAASVIADLQRNAPERAVTVVIAPYLTAMADARLLRILLENLLSNAWKFTRKRPDARIEVGAQDEEGQTVFFVRDNGAGFDMTYAAKLFGPFQRLHAMTDFEGTGVGLATVQRIVRRHGGRIWAEAAVNEGATFY